MDVRQYNRSAWSSEVSKQNKWTLPVSTDEIARARRGQWSIVLTPLEPVPASWFPELEGCRVLGLASAGGQQAPILAAAGADVVVYDNCPDQLAQDRKVAERDGLQIECVEGDMADLGVFGDASFDLIFHPVSNCFVQDVRPVWREAFRVLRPGGVMLAGFCNPVTYVFDDEASQKGELVARHKLPYSDLTSIDDAERQRYIDANEPLAFGHTLGDQIGGQLDAGFLLAGFYEDYADGGALAQYMPTFIATRSIKPG